MTTATERNVASAEAYYQAMHNKDLAGVARHLHPDVRFLGPLADLTGKEAVLEAAKRFVNLTKSLRVRAKFGSDEHGNVGVRCRFWRADRDLPYRSADDV